MTLAAKLKTVGDFTAFLLSQFAAVGAGLSLGTDRFSLRALRLRSDSPETSTDLDRPEKSLPVDLPVP